MDGQWTLDHDGVWRWGAWLIEHDGRPGRGAHYVLLRRGVEYGRFGFPASARRAALRAEGERAERDYGCGFA